MEELDSDRLVKRILQLERLDDAKTEHQDVAMDDLHLTMQPPRMTSRHPYDHQMPDMPSIMPKMWDGSRPAAFGALASRADMRPDKMQTNSFRENAMTSHVISPADEGSRTGLKGSGVQNLLNSGSANPAPLGSAHPAPGSSFSGLPPGQSKPWSQPIGIESTFTGSKQPGTLSTRQMTIFYGGQAHVFDDVPSEKAEAIMTLAGSSGRSWSTVYSHRLKGSDTLLQSEGTMQTQNMEREKLGSKYFAIKGCGSHPLPPDVLNSMNVSSSGRRGGSYSAPTKAVDSSLGRWAVESHDNADIGVSSLYKPESRGKLPPMRLLTGQHKDRDEKLVKVLE